MFIILMFGLPYFIGGLIRRAWMLARRRWTETDEIFFWTPTPVKKFPKGTLTGKAAKREMDRRFGRGEFYKKNLK